MPNKKINVERIHEKNLTVYIKSLKIFLKKVAQFKEFLEDKMIKISNKFK